MQLCNFYFICMTVKAVGRIDVSDQYSGGVTCVMSSIRLLTSRQGLISPRGPS